ALESVHSIELNAKAAGLLTCFILWLHLAIDASNTLDALEDPGSWLPVYLPALPEGVRLEVGDRIVATVERTLCENGLNPDFLVRGQLFSRSDGTRSFQFALPHQSKTFRGNE